MKLSLVAMAVGLISVGSACMETLITFNQYTNVIENAYVYVRLSPSSEFHHTDTPQDNNGFACYLTDGRPISIEGQDIALTCETPPTTGKYDAEGAGYTAVLLKRDGSYLKKGDPHKWAMLMDRGNWVASFALQQQGNWDDEKVYMTGRVWDCDDGETYDNVQQYAEGLWA